MQLKRSGQDKLLDSLIDSRGKDLAASSSFINDSALNAALLQADARTQLTHSDDMEFSAAMFMFRIRLCVCLFGDPTGISKYRMAKLHVFVWVLQYLENPFYPTVEDAFLVIKWTLSTY
jgi:hypothetical protein